MQNPTEKKAGFGGIFAAFELSDMAEALSQDLTPSALDLYMLLHSLTPFGNYYCWNKQMDRKGLREALTRKRGIRKGEPMHERTFQRAVKLLEEQGLVRFTDKGYKLLNPHCRKPKQPKQLNIFGWFNQQLSQLNQPRQNCREEAPEVAPSTSFGEGKEWDLSNKTIKITNTQQARSFVLPTASIGQEIGEVAKAAVPEIKRKIKIKGEARAERVSSAPRAFTKLDNEILELVESAGIPRERINRNLVAVLNSQPVSAIRDAVAYLCDRAQKSVIVNLSGYLVRVVQGQYWRATAAEAEPAAPSPEHLWFEAANALSVCNHSTTDENGQREFWLADGTHGYLYGSFEAASALYPLEVLQSGLAQPSYRELEALGFPPAYERLRQAGQGLKQSAPEPQRDYSQLESIHRNRPPSRQVPVNPEILEALHRIQQLQQERASASADNIAALKPDDDEPSGDIRDLLGMRPAPGEEWMTTEQLAQRAAERMFGPRPEPSEAEVAPVDLGFDGADANDDEPSGDIRDLLGMRPAAGEEWMTPEQLAQRAAERMFGPRPESSEAAEIEADNDADNLGAGPPANPVILEALRRIQQLQRERASAPAPVDLGFDGADANDDEPSGDIRDLLGMRPAPGEEWMTPEQLAQRAAERMFGPRPEE